MKTATKELSAALLRRLALLRERAKLLRLAIDEIEKLPEVIAS